MATIPKALILGLILCLFLAPCLVTPASAQDSPFPAVELDCGSDPVMDVRPSSDAEIAVTCTVTNPTSASEEISISEIEWDGDSIEMALSEDSFTLAAGEEDTFEILFTGQTKIPASEEYSFKIEAKIVSWNNLDTGVVPEFLEGTLIPNATHSGDLKIETYGMVELQVSDVTTRYMEVSDEVEFSIQVINKGNADDKLEIVFANAAELEAAGFSFPNGTRVSENVDSQDTSSEKTLTIRAPPEVSSDLRMPLLIRAQSTNDDSAPFSEINIQLDVKSSTQSGDGDGLSALGSGDTLLYVSIGGGAILVILFLVILVRVISKKKPKDQLQLKVHQPIILPDEPVEEADDVDDFFSDLDDEIVEGDDFDDLFDEL